MLAGAALSVPLADGPGSRLALVGYAAVVGVGIDLDHFLLARLETGDWAAVRRCLADPWRVVGRQDEIFPAGEVGALQRLLSHVLLAGVAVAALALVDRPLALLTGVVLYLHVLADLYGDNAVRGTLPWQTGPGRTRAD